MSGRALLSRIAGAGPADEVESILAHVRVLLNTRAGESPSAPRFGILDFSDMAHQFPGGLQALSASIRATILEFEPRLKAVAVRHAPLEEGLAIRFEITAQRAGPGARVLRMATTIRPGGRIDVTG